MKQPADHPTFSFPASPRPNVPFSELPDMTYREGMEHGYGEHETIPRDWERPILWLAAILILVFAGMVFWPTILEFFTPVKIAFVFGTLFGMIAGIGVLSLITIPCGDEYEPPKDRIDPETVKACASARSVWRTR